MSSNYLYLCTNVLISTWFIGVLLINQQAYLSILVAQCDDVLLMKQFYCFNNCCTYILYVIKINYFYMDVNLAELFPNISNSVFFFFSILYPRTTYQFRLAFFTLWLCNFHFLFFLYLIIFRDNAVVFTICI